MQNNLVLRVFPDSLPRLSPQRESLACETTQLSTSNTSVQHPPSRDAVAHVPSLQTQNTSLGAGVAAHLPSATPTNGHGARQILVVWRGRPLTQKSRVRGRPRYTSLARVTPLWKNRGLVTALHTTSSTVRISTVVMNNIN